MSDSINLRFKKKHQIRYACHISVLNVGRGVADWPSYLDESLLPVLVLTILEVVSDDLSAVFLVLSRDIEALSSLVAHFVSLEVEMRSRVATGLGRVDVLALSRTRDAEIV